MESKYHLYIIKPNDILGSQKQEENKNFYIVLQVSQNGLFIPSSVTSVKEDALKGNILYTISHVFVDMSKEECPFADVLDNSNLKVYYKDEFECISGVYLPKLPE